MYLQSEKKAVTSVETMKEINNIYNGLTRSMTLKNALEELIRRADIAEYRLSRLNVKLSLEEKADIYLLLAYLAEEIGQIKLQKEALELAYYTWDKFKESANNANLGLSATQVINSMLD